MRIRTRIFLFSVMLSVLATASHASMITNGTFSIAGSVFVTGTGGITTPAGTCNPGVQCIFWQDTGTPAQNGKVDISPFGLPNGDIPTGIAGNSAGNISSLLNPPEVVDVPGFPATTFMSFANGGVTTILDVNFIFGGINGSAGCSLTPPATGQVCSPAGSPFNLQNLSPTQSTASFRMSGVTNDSSSTWTGIFTSQFNNMSYQDVLAAFASNGFVENTFSAQITLTAPAPVPEPEQLSMFLLGTGMIACAAFIRRFSRR